MKNKKQLITLALFVFITATGFSQQTIQSAQQKICKWNSKTQQYDNCSNQNVDYQLIINSTEKKISIKHNNVNRLFKIVNKKPNNDMTVYQAIEATGLGVTIAINTEKKQCLITYKQVVKKTLFY